MSENEENPAATFTDEELVKGVMSTAIACFVASLKKDVEESNFQMDLAYVIVTELRRRGEEALKKLLPVLAHEDDSIRLAAAWALLPTHPDEARPVLEEIASKGFWSLAIDAQGLLGRWKKS